MSSIARIPLPCRYNRTSPTARSDRCGKCCPDAKGRLVCGSSSNLITLRPSAALCGSLRSLRSKEFCSRRERRGTPRAAEKKPMSILKTTFAIFFLLSIAHAQGTRLLRHPTVSRDSIAFEYAGDLWVVSRSGGTARRLTSTPSSEIDPYFSPDGSQIAFTATVAGNTDVYVVPA